MTRNAYELGWIDGHKRVLKRNPYLTHIPEHAQFEKGYNDAFERGMIDAKAYLGSDFIESK